MIQYCSNEPQKSSQGKCWKLCEKHLHVLKVSGSTKVSKILSNKAGKLSFDLYQNNILAIMKFDSLVFAFLEFCVICISRGILHPMLMRYRSKKVALGYVI
jgi:hypothetical protein